MLVTFRCEDEHLLDQNDFVGCLFGKFFLSIQGDHDQHVAFEMEDAVNSSYALFSMLSLLEYSYGTLTYSEIGTIMNYRVHLKDDRLTMKLVEGFYTDDIPSQCGVFAFSCLKPAFIEAFQQYLATLTQRNPLITENPTFRRMTRCNISMEWLEFIFAEGKPAFIRGGLEVPPLLEYNKKRFHYRPDES